MDIRTLMKQNGFGRTFQGMSVSALRKAIAKARRTGDILISRGSHDMPVEVADDILAIVEGRPPVTASTAAPSVLQSSFSMSLTDSGTESASNFYLPMQLAKDTSELPLSLVASNIGLTTPQVHAKEPSTESTLFDLDKTQTSTGTAGIRMLAPAQTYSRPFGNTKGVTEKEVDHVTKKAGQVMRKATTAQSTARKRKTAGDQKPDSDKLAPAESGLEVQSRKRKASPAKQNQPAKKAKRSGGDPANRPAMQQEIEYASEDLFETARKNTMKQLKDATLAKNRARAQGVAKRKRQEAEATKAKQALGATDGTERRDTDDVIVERVGEDSDVLRGVLTSEGPAVGSPTGTVEDAHQMAEDSDDASEESDHELKPVWLRRTGFSPARENVITDEMKKKIKELSDSAPPYLYHVHSFEGKRKTTGLASQEKVQPAAAVDQEEHGHVLYNSIYDFPTLSELLFNFGSRILWMRRKADQFSSYTTSLLFAIVHAMGRKTREETEIYISIIDTRTAKTVQGDPVEFYYVPQLQQILHAPEWHGWGDSQWPKLMAPWFTHEYVAHGTANLGDNALRMVPLEELIQHGLYHFAPGIHDPEQEGEMKKLYHRCVQMRHYWYGSSVAATPFDRRHLAHAVELARLFDPSISEMNSTELDFEEQLQRRPIHLQIFLDSCGLSKRQKNDVLFVEYIRSRFSAYDVQDIVYPSMTKIASNLSERMQTLHRIREACTAFGVPVPGPTTVVRSDVNFDFMGIWRGRLEDILTPKKKEKVSTETTENHGNEDQEGEEDFTLAADGDEGTSALKEAADQARPSESGDADVEEQAA